MAFNVLAISNNIKFNFHDIIFNETFKINLVNDEI